MLATEHLCWPPDIYCGHWIDGQILADGGTLGKRKPWDFGKFGWSRFDQDVVGVRRWRVRYGLPTTREVSHRGSNLVLVPPTASCGQIALICRDSCSFAAAF